MMVQGTGKHKIMYVPRRMTSGLTVTANIYYPPDYEVESVSLTENSDGVYLYEYNFAVYDLHYIKFYENGSLKFCDGCRVTHTAVGGMRPTISYESFTDEEKEKLFETLKLILKSTKGFIELNKLKKAVEKIQSKVKEYTERNIEDNLKSSVNENSEKIADMINKLELSLNKSIFKFDKMNQKIDNGEMIMEKVVASLLTDGKLEKIIKEKSRGGI